MWTIIVVVVILFVAIGSKLYMSNDQKRDEKKPAAYKYRRQEYFMSRAEREFFIILVAILEPKYYVFPQVHLPQILDHKIKNGQSWKGALSTIDRKSVDFVICDKAYIKPLLAIELDDSTHQEEDRQARDSLVERICSEAGMPLLRFANHGSFDKADMSQRLATVLDI